MIDPYSDADDYNDNASDISSARLQLEFPVSMAPERLDTALSRLLPDYSRSRLQQWIKQGAVTVEGKTANIPNTKLFGGETINVAVQRLQEELAFRPESIKLAVVFEDEDILVINKPSGLVVHPAAGNWSGTLLNALLHHCAILAHLPRAGIVHRLDKNTSGLMVVAKTLRAQTELVRQLQAHRVARIYRAIANGRVPSDGTINAAIGRDPHNRLRMAVVKFGGKSAVTHVRVLQRFNSHSYIECRLETGRTHQIRTHLRAAHHALAGDPLYGDPHHNMPDAIADAIKRLDRQALHAYRLSLRHPVTDEEMSWTAPLPEDIRHLLLTLQATTGARPPTSPIYQAYGND